MNLIWITVGNVISNRHCYMARNEISYCLGSGGHRFSPPGNKFSPFPLLLTSFTADICIRRKYCLMSTLTSSLIIFDVLPWLAFTNRWPIRGCAIRLFIGIIKRNLSIIGNSRHISIDSWTFVSYTVCTGTPWEINTRGRRHFCRVGRIVWWDTRVPVSCIG